LGDVTIKQLKTYVISCDGSFFNECEGCYEDCDATVTVQATSKYEALRSVPDGWDELIRHTGEHVRCPRKHEW
jgi:hypothetical protein